MRPLENRGWGAQSSAAILAMLSARSIDQQVASMLDQSPADYLRKPFRCRELVDALESVLPPRAAAAPYRADAPAVPA